jgi:ribonucleoside-triphosphate reductase
MKTKCEVYSRVVGYIRPVKQWNEGKQAEWKLRKVFKTNKAVEKLEEQEKCVEIKQAA